MKKAKVPPTTSDDLARRRHRALVEKAQRKYAALVRKKT